MTIIAAMLTWVFSSSDNPHYLLLIGMLTVMTLSFVEAYARRYSRVYLPLLTVLLVAWIARLTVFSPEQGPLATAAIVDISGPVVVGTVAVVYVAMAVIMVWSRERKATGEMYDRDKEGDWKP